VPAEIPTSHSAEEEVVLRPRKHFLGTALWIAALANVLIPAVLFSVSRFFGLTDLRYRALVAFVVFAEYAIAFLLFLLHANVGFAAGYAFATATTVTLGSAALAFITLVPAGWTWSGGEIVVVAGFCFAVLSNVVFLIASIRYARAIHPRLHLGGFFLGMMAFVALVFLYIRTVS
jgi:hypothetical protein